MDIGIVGAGPAGLFIALCLLDAGVRYQIHLFDSSDRIGGRTRMSTYGGVRVVAGAGVVRERDVLMRRLAERFHVPLSRFMTNIQRPSGAIDIMRTIRRLRPLVDREKTFSENFMRTLGEDAYHRFVESSGSTDYQDADVCDTIDDYGFQDNTGGQVMFGIDWDRLMRSMLRACRSHDNFHLHLSTPITSVRRIRGGGFSLNHDEWIVRELFWTAPRPSWHILPISSKKWRSVMRGVACQSFLRAYSKPIDPVIAKHKFPHTTFMPFGNPVQKIIPYRDGVYMVAYCDNASADAVHKHPEDLSQWTGVRWHEPVVFYHPCGTHFFRPLDTTLWHDRDEFLRYARHPSPHIYVCGEGLSRNQGWTEGALESVLSVLS